VHFYRNVIGAFPHGHSALTLDRGATTTHREYEALQTTLLHRVEQRCHREIPLDTKNPVTARNDLYST
jgi:hypothetical protein